MVIKKNKIRNLFWGSKNPSNLKREQMREDTTDNLNIAQTYDPYENPNLLLLPSPRHLHMTYSLTFLAIVSLVWKEVTCRRHALYNYLQVLAILPSLIPFIIRNTWFSLYYKSRYSIMCLFNTTWLHTPISEHWRGSLWSFD